MMDRLISIVCIDESFAFELDYYYDFFGRIKKQKRIVNKKNPSIDSISEKYPVADFYEREIHECFGIEFEKGSNKRLFLPENNEIKNPLVKKKEVKKNA